MPRTPKAAPQAPSTMKELKDTLWKAADKLRGSMDASQYKDVILGLVFLKYVSDAFDERRDGIRAELAADGYDEDQIAELIDDVDEYTGRGVFWVPANARWGFLAENAKGTSVDVAAEASRGKHFSPPLSSDELAFYDAVATNESAVDIQGEDVLAQIARELVAVMRRDVRTDWTVRDDVRAKLRSSIKRLLVKYKYPPDKQPEAIKLVMEQMEAMAPRYADDRGQ
ncbi:MULTISPECIES: type I restriction enzyme endonuclease domain-containing protein [Microbacterium]|uniref:type I restriction enzyme endonuclease domain-containing protein n=1 Tax=Microbacterium TaxID=33882 RepID=UPI00217DA5F7|nr:MULTISPECIES: type I restriction enzyme endonuclease domain-containing protein [Microbacterium]UWF78039.1 DUF3387 domain-containing protein [Microbacterium neungamense]WCM56217.1 DUF3387 domain-containing protein [Microbacterium sp. EF45047]